jgi:hypothetical protein
VRFSSARPGVTSSQTRSKITDFTRFPFWLPKAHLPPDALSLDVFASRCHRPAGLGKCDLGDAPITRALGSRVFLLCLSRTSYFAAFHVLDPTCTFSRVGCGSCCCVHSSLQWWCSAWYFMGGSRISMDIMTFVVGQVPRRACFLTHHPLSVSSCVVVC